MRGRLVSARASSLRSILKLRQFVSCKEPRLGATTAATVRFSEQHHVRELTDEDEEESSGNGEGGGDGAHACASEHHNASESNAIDDDDDE